MTPTEREEGFSTVMGLSLALVVLALSAVVASLGVVSVARHRAEATADLAALAAAKHALEGQAAACQAARLLADRQSATLLDCRLEGLDAVVVIGVVPPGRIGSLGMVRGTARAGAR